MKINQIIRKIQMMNNQELNEVVYAVNFRRANLSKMLRKTFKVGDKVNVVERNQSTPGIIKKIAVKRAIVDMNGMSYRVPLNMLVAA